jgi:hypothetical protein
MEKEQVHPRGSTLLFIAEVINTNVAGLKLKKHRHCWKSLEYRVTICEVVDHWY